MHCFVEAERLDPSDAAWPYLQGLIQTSGNPAAAAAKLRRGAELCGNVPDAPRLRLALLLLAEGNPTRAEEHFREVLRFDPDNAQCSFRPGPSGFYQRGLAVGPRTSGPLPGRPNDAQSRANAPGSGPRTAGELSGRPGLPTGGGGTQRPSVARPFRARGESPPNRQEGVAASRPYPS